MRVWQRSRRRSRMFSWLREEKQRAREREREKQAAIARSEAAAIIAMARSAGQLKCSAVQCYRIIAFPLLHVSCHEVPAKLYMPHRFNFLHVCHKYIIVNMYTLPTLTHMSSAKKNILNVYITVYFPGNEHTFWV